MLLRKRVLNSIRLALSTSEEVGSGDYAVGFAAGLNYARSLIEGKGDSQLAALYRYSLLPERMFEGKKGGRTDAKA